MIGRTLAHYRITAKLGEGGMGEVWRATDSRLDRDVALKVLPEEFARDPERLERFTREARAVAALNHPNVVTIHSVEEAGGVHLLIMELVEGQSLDQLLPADGFDLDQLFPLAIQISDALAAAHEQGIVHRDLKPANVMVTGAGRVKVLDFGLAKLAAPEGVDGDELPTVGLSQTLTQPGMVLGTVPYMSPEQVQAQAVDQRSDIFSLGIVLYEMATGKRPFRGDNPASVMSSILRDQPPAMTNLKADLPDHLGRIVRRCLEKEPRRRYPSAREVQIELEGLERELSLADSTQRASSKTVESPARRPGGERVARWWKTLALALGLSTSALGVIWLSGVRSGSSDRPLEVSAMELLTDLPGSQKQPSLSPDGTQLLYVAEEDGDLDIFLLRVGGQNAINLTPDFDGRDHHPAWSPDGQRIAFSSDRDGGGVFVMGATGESPLRVSDEGFHPAWSPDGERLVVNDEDISDPYDRSRTSRLTILELASGRGREIPVRGDAAQGRWSPDGRLIAYWTSDKGQRDIRVVSSSAGEAAGTQPYVEITDDVATDWGPVWSPDGEALYFVSDRSGSPDLWRVPIRAANGAANGPLERVTTGVARVVAASLARDGRRIAIETERTSAGIERLAFDPEAERPLGPPEKVLWSSNDLDQVALSRDEQWLAYRSRSPREDLFVIRVDGSSRRQLTDDEARDRGPTWGPQDEWVLFYSNRDGDYQHWIVRSDGTGLRQVARHPDGALGSKWSGDGRWIASGFGGGPQDLRFRGGLYEVDPSWLDPSATFEPATVEAQFGMSPVGWSPDDRFLHGFGLNGSGAQLAIYEVDSGQLTFLEKGDGRPFRPSSKDSAWLDTDRLIVWDDEDSAAYAVEVGTGASRQIPGLPGPAEFRVADGGRTLYSLRTELDADIWLLTLDDPVEADR